ncbi:MAG: ABC transporter permease [Eubacteriaceae bacterium]|jgi:spermidine/putrescine transport system permease protein|nr:ABC transporter permease [Eubacteriaceae bacterium]
MVGKKLRKAYVYLLLAFFYLPIAVLVVYSFNENRTNRIWGGFSLRWYAALFSDRQILSALYYTLLCAALATLVSTVIGTASAIAIDAMEGRSRSLYLNLNYIPVINPDIVTGISMLLVFASAGIRLGMATMLIAHITFCTPYVILSILPKLKQMDRHLVEAALDLGATPMQALFKVVLPDIRAGVSTGALLAFTLSVDDFAISFFNTGSGVTNLSIYVYSAAKKGISPEVNALSTVMILSVAILLFIVNKRSLNNNTSAKGEKL